MSNARSIVLIGLRLGAILLGRPRRACGSSSIAWSSGIPLFQGQITSTDCMPPDRVCRVGRGDSRATEDLRPGRTRRHLVSCTLMSEIGAIRLTLSSVKPRRGWIFPEEAAAIARAGVKRREEFTAGRNAARRALARFGVEARVDSGPPTQRPQWPPGYVGSIGPCEGFCGAVVARRRDALALGFDAEEASPLNAEIVKLVCGVDESPITRFRQTWERPTGPNWPSAPRKHFIIPITGEEFDFLDVSVRFSANYGHFGGAFAIAMSKDLIARSVRQRLARGAWRRDDRWVYAGIALLSDRTSSLALADVRAGNADQ